MVWPMFNKKDSFAWIQPVSRCRERLTVHPAGLQGGVLVPNRHRVDRHCFKSLRQRFWLSSHMVSSSPSLNSHSFVSKPQRILFVSVHHQASSSHISLSRVWKVFTITWGHITITLHHVWCRWGDNNHVKRSTGPTANVPRVKSLGPAHSLRPPL